MIATIELEQIKIYAYHGCYAEEQKVGNNFIVDITLRVESSLSASTDDIRNALNYVDVVGIVKEEMAQKSHLLENVVSRICTRIQSQFANSRLVGGSIRVAKMAPPVGVEMKCVAVKMEF